MRQAFRCAALLLAGACAGAGGGPGEPLPDPRLPAARPTAQGYEILAPRPLPAASHRVEAPVARVWAVLPDAFEDVSLPATRDETAFTVHARDLLLRGSLAGQPLSAFVDCGVTAAGIVANVYRVSLSVTTRVEEDAEGTRVATEVTARASNPGSSSAPVRCASTGRLEGLVIARLQERLRGG